MTFNHASQRAVPTRPHTIPRPASERRASATSEEGLSPAGGLVLRRVESYLEQRRAPSDPTDPGRGRRDGGPVEGRVGPETDFLARRTLRELATLRDDEREALLQVAEALAALQADPDPDPSCHPKTEALDHALLLWAGFLERRHRLEGAGRVLEAAISTSPEKRELLLHAARVYRKAGDMERARSLYRRVRSSDGPDMRLTLMAEIGLALLSSGSAKRLGRVLRRAVRTGEMEVAAVAHEERAHARRRAGDRTGALRDYAAACLRYRDPADRGRVLHAAADVLVAAADPLAARQVLLEIEALGVPGQWSRARSRLREISRRIGDELGMRRWKVEAHRKLVSLAPSKQVAPERSLLPEVSRWIGRLRGGALQAG